MISRMLTSFYPTVLHPYYKLNYIAHEWGGPQEQKEDIQAGHLDAKDWQAEALKIFEETVCIQKLYRLDQIDSVLHYLY